MICPHCKDEVLVTLENEQIEVEYCVTCNGLWLDTGELELLFGDAESAASFLTIGAPAQPPAGEKPRKCPECDARMTKEATESDPPVIFDHCPKGDGLWFDRDEVNTVLEHADALGHESPVRNFLLEIFPELRK